MISLNEGNLVLWTSYHFTTGHECRDLAEKRTFGIMEKWLLTEVVAYENWASWEFLTVFMWQEVLLEWIYERIIYVNCG